MSKPEMMTKFEYHLADGDYILQAVKDMVEAETRNVENGKYREDVTMMRLLAIGNFLEKYQERNNAFLESLLQVKATA